jgi:rod shape-determining protein MreC
MKKFLSSFKSFAIFFVAIGLILLALGGYLSPVLVTLSRPVLGAQEWISSRYVAINQLVNAPQDVEELRLRNIELESEVSRLQSQIIILQEQLDESQGLEELLGYARRRPEFQYAAAAVIGKDPSPFLHYIIIDHGSDEGIRRGMPVVTQSGLVGRIDAVTAGAARVQLITDPGSVVNVKLQAQKVNAQINGSITGEITLDMVPQDTNLEPGEVILTSGLGGNYPADILIGQVITVRQFENELFQTATLQPIVDYSQLQAVLVIKNFRPIDITPLEPSSSE